MRSKFDALTRAFVHSEGKLLEIRQRIELLVPPGEIVLTCGSYARRESSAESDLDFFVISSQAAKNASDLQWFEKLRNAIGEIVHTEPAEGGAFAKVETLDSMIHDIGGENDSNAKITRRMLFLLEGEWLFNQEGLKGIRKKILERYIGEGISDHQLALFLLNDVIRYYRTMAVDYENKTSEGENPKPWGIRNIKLIFSRKLLYASGLFSIGRTADRSRDQKIKILETLFDMPVIDRMAFICSEPKMQPLLACYDRFLAQLENPDTRNLLKMLGRDQRENATFRELKNEGHNFTRELMKLFEATFDSTHPIHRAVIF